MSSNPPKGNTETLALPILLKVKTVHCPTASGLQWPPSLPPTSHWRQLSYLVHLDVKEAEKKGAAGQPCAAQPQSRHHDRRRMDLSC